MVNHPRPPHHRSLQAHPRLLPLLPPRRLPAPLHHQHLLNLGPPRQRRPSKLLGRQIRPRRSLQSHRQRMGSRLRRPREHGRLRIHSDAVNGCEGEGRECDAAGWDEGGVGDTGEAG